MKPLQISEPASQELAEAVRWYEERRPGWGGRLLEAVSRALELIEQHPESGSPRKVDRMHVNWLSADFRIWSSTGIDQTTATSSPSLTQAVDRTIGTIGLDQMDLSVDFACVHASKLIEPHNTPEQRLAKSLS